MFLGSLLKCSHPVQSDLLEYASFVPVVMLGSASGRLLQTLDERVVDEHGGIEGQMLLELPRDCLAARVSCVRTIEHGRERLDPHQQQHEQSWQRHLVEFEQCAG